MTFTRRLAVLTAVTALGVGGTHARAQQASAPQVDQLIAVLQGGAPTHDKARACQQLAALGANEAVPALTALLTDRELGAYARSGLEAIPDPSAGAALRKALGELHGLALVGVVNSLGVRRDAESVGALTGLVGSPDVLLAEAAVSALGRIGTSKALSAVERVLDHGSPNLAVAAADALLGAAERLRTQGQRGQAARICEHVRKASVPEHVRLAAAGRLIVARQSAGLPILAELLRSGDVDSVHVAVAASREMPGPKVTRALAGEMARVSATVQPWLVQALLDRNDPAVLPAVESAASAGSPEARAAALNALGGIGDASSLPILLRAAASDGSEAERSAALSSLVRLPAPEASAAIARALPSCGAATKASLISVLGKRKATSAVDALLQAAADPDTGVSRAASNALASLSRPGDLPQILHLTLACKDPDARDAGAAAVVATCYRIPDVGGRTAALEDAYAKTSDSASRSLLLRMLGQVGTYGAYRAVRSHLDDADGAIRMSAISSLAAWHDATPVPALLKAASTSTDSELRSVALRGAIRLAGQTAEECPTPSVQLIGWLDDASRLVGTDLDAKRMLLSALGNLRSAEALGMIRLYLAEPAVEAEAAQAAIRIAGQLSGEPRQVAKSVLQTMALQSKNESVRAQLVLAAQQIAGPAILVTELARSSGEVDVSRLTFHPLFDGKTLTGWDDNGSGAFRIEDGAIVGGSTKAGLNQNEFLCTTRSYANFVLRAECKLVGPANGGIQIRSHRVPMSSEVCGYQADMDSTGQYWGCLYDESRRGMLVQADRAVTDRVVKKNDWNAYEIRCEGPRIRLYVNGTLTADYTEKDPEVLLSGIIGVQIHAGSPSETWYRNIEIAELP